MRLAVKMMMMMMGDLPVTMGEVSAFERIEPILQGGRQQWRPRERLTDGGRPRTDRMQTMHLECAVCIPIPREARRTPRESRWHAECWP